MSTDFEKMYGEEQKSEEVSEQPIVGDGPQDKPANPESALNNIPEEQEYTNFKYTPRSNNGGGNSKKGFDISKDEVEPLSVDTSKLKTFARVYAGYSEVKIPSSLLPLLDYVSDKVNNLGFTLRSGYEGERNDLETQLDERASRTEYYNIWKSANNFPVDTDLVEKLKVPKPTKKSCMIACGLDVKASLDYQEYRLSKKENFTPLTVKDFVRNFNNGKFIFKVLNCRQIHILLGDDCETRLNVMFIYTECGSDSTKVDYKRVGYAKRVINKCNEFNIPVLNLGNPDFKNQFDKFITAFNN